MDMVRLQRFEEALSGLLAACPVGADVKPLLRSQRLRRIRRGLASGGHLGLAVPARHGGCGEQAAQQALLQFICGYYDVDLRDSTGLGHGRLVARNTVPRRSATGGCRSCFAGAVPGIAITEPHGGSRPIPRRPPPLPTATDTGRSPGRRPGSAA